MNKEELRDAVERLTLELLNFEAPTPEAQQKIDALLQQLSKPEAITTASAEHEPLYLLVEDLLLQFETEHPNLGALLRNVANLLTSIGI